jgi:hypothetical protein
MHTNPIFCLVGKGEVRGKEGDFKLMEFVVPKCILCDYVFYSSFVPKFPIATNFISYVLPKVLLLLTI